MNLQRLMGHIRRAVEDYGMIESGDRIAVGVSGGKDSMSLLAGLAAMRGYFPREYKLEAVTVSLGLPGVDMSPITRLCGSLGVRHTIIETNIAEVLFDIRKEKNPCALCAKIRKGAFNKAAKGLGCNKIAYAHNRDDLIETFFLNLFYEGRIGAFAPVTELDRSGLTLIRPMLYVPEGDVVCFVREQKLEIVQNPCPANGKTRREDMKGLMAQYRAGYGSFDQKMLSAIKGSNMDGWG